MGVDADSPLPCMRPERSLGRPRNTRTPLAHGSSTLARQRSHRQCLCSVVPLDGLSHELRRGPQVRNLIRSQRRKARLNAARPRVSAGHAAR